MGVAPGKNMSAKRNLERRPNFSTAAQPEKMPRAAQAFIALVYSVDSSKNNFEETHFLVARVDRNCILEKLTLLQRERMSLEGGRQK